MAGGDLDSVYRTRFGEREARSKLELWTRDRRVPVAAGSPPTGPSWTSPATAGTSSATSTPASGGRPTSGTCTACLRRDGARSSRSTGCELASARPDTTTSTSSFMSNYLEHLPSSEAVAAAAGRGRARSSSRAAGSSCSSRTSGSSAASYWDFLDHRVAAHGPQPARGGRARRLRRSSASSPGCLPVHAPRAACRSTRSLVRAYLRFPPAWRLLGKQALMVARRPPRSIRARWSSTVR